MLFAFPTVYNFQMERALQQYMEHSAQESTAIPVRQRVLQTISLLMSANLYFNGNAYSYSISANMTEQPIYAINFPSSYKMDK